MKRLTIRQTIHVVTVLFVCSGSAHLVSAVAAGPPALESSSGQDLQIEITRKGLGKEVLLRQGAREWFMLVEVTPENTVVIRQEKNQDAYLVDESETHDRPLTAAEVDTVIEDFINSVKTQTQSKRK